MLISESIKKETVLLKIWFFRREEHRLSVDELSTLVLFFTNFGYWLWNFFVTTGKIELGRVGIFQSHSNFSMEFPLCFCLNSVPLNYTTRKKRQKPVKVVADNEETRFVFLSMLCLNVGWGKSFYTVMSFADTPTHSICSRMSTMCNFRTHWRITSHTGPSINIVYLSNFSAFTAVFVTIFTLVHQHN